MKRLAILAGLAMAAPANAQLGDFTGNDILRTCRATEAGKAIACLQYLNGVVNGIELASPDGEEPFIIPRGVDTTQIRDVVLRYLDTNPDKRHWASAVLIWNALLKAFPNPKLQTRPPQD